MKNELLKSHKKDTEAKEPFWHDWSEEAILRARREKKPIFLHITYPSCYRGRVMEKESFSHPEIAKLLQDLFVCIQIDRETRPDLDQLYRRAVQAMTGQEGWPINVFLTPELRPFYGGTYFSFTSQYKKASFREILQKIARVYKEDSADVQKSSDSITNFLFQTGRYFESKKLNSQDLFSKALKNLEKIQDQEFGGFGSSPKFFHTEAFHFFLHAAQTTGQSFYLDSVKSSLLKVLSSGVYDHVEGGVFRFSSDREWQKPYPEKSLCDSALMAKLLTAAFEKTGDEIFKEIAKKTLDFMTTKLRSSAGLFWSSEYAESLEEASEYYFFRSEEWEKHFSKQDQERLKETFRLTGEPGSVCWRHAISSELLSANADLIDQLRKLRQQKTSIRLNEKVQTSWNALAISALIHFAKVSGEASFWMSSKVALEYFSERLLKGDPVSHVFEGSIGFLEDYVFLANAFLDAEAFSGEEIYLKAAEKLSRQILDSFYDSKSGGFWTTAEQQKDLLMRTKEVHDSAMPSAFSYAILLFHRLYKKTDNENFREVAIRSAESILGTAEEEPGGFSSLARVVEILVQSEAE